MKSKLEVDGISSKLTSIAIREFGNFTFSTPCIWELKPKVGGISSIVREFGNSISFASLGNGALII
jgi:hypothetical protein